MIEVVGGFWVVFVYGVEDVVVGMICVVVVDMCGWVVGLDVG